MSLLVNAPATRKTVLVLGHTAAGLPLPLNDEIDDSIVVLAIGWPLTETQRGVLEGAERTARDAQVTFDAHLLASANGIAPLVAPTDRVLMDADPREARRIRRALDRR